MLQTLFHYIKSKIFVERAVQIKEETTLPLPPPKRETRCDAIKRIAAHYGWAFYEEQTNPPMLSFKKDTTRINIYHTTMTVVTALNHPVQGKKQLVRRDVNGALLKQIFENPRVHTGIGYYKK